MIGDLCMKYFSIVADATCDLTEEYQKAHDIQIVPAHIVLPDKREIDATPDWDWCPCTEFYRNLKRNPNSYTTAPANVFEFACAMERQAEQGRDMLVMTISTGISGAYHFALQARDMVKEKYPDVQIVCVDSLRFGMGFGMLVLQAAACRDKGMSLEETASYLNENKNRFHQAGWHDDLAFVAKKGRITHAKAFFGTLAGILPIGEFDYNGLTTVIGKVKGTKTGYQALLHYIEQTAEDLENQTVFIAHSDRLKQAQTYKQMIEERFHPKEVVICDLFASCGINVGGGLMAAYYVGKPVSEDLSVEREILENFLKGV